MLLTGLLSLDPAGANLALPVAISVKAGTDSIAPAAPTDDPSVAASPAHEFLSLLGMLLEDDNPPAAFSTTAESSPPASGASTTAQNGKRKKDGSSNPESGNECSRVISLAPLPAPVPDSITLSVPVTEPAAKTDVPAVEGAAPAVEAEAPAAEIPAPVVEKTQPIVPAGKPEAVAALPAIQDVEPAAEVTETVMDAERPRISEDPAAWPVESALEPAQAAEPVCLAPLTEAAPVSSPAAEPATIKEPQIQENAAVSPTRTIAPAGRPLDNAALPVEAAAGQTAPVDEFVRPATAPAAELAFAMRVNPAPRTDRLVPTLRFRDTLSAARPAVARESLEMDVPAAREEAAPVAAAPEVERTPPASSMSMQSAEREAPAAAPASGSTPETSRQVRRISPEVRTTGGAHDEKPLRRAPEEAPARTIQPDAPAAETGSSSERRVRPAAPAAVLLSHNTAPAEASRIAPAPGGDTLPADAPAKDVQPAAVPRTSAPELTATQGEPPKPSSEPVRQVTLEISAPNSDQRVTVDMVEGEGGLHVSVRSDDSDLSASLRHELGDLVNRLENSGFDTDTWSRDSGSQQDSPQRDAQPDSGAGQRDRRRQPAWVDELQPRRPNRAEESFTWHLQSATGTT